jgi:hypothetical protein
LQSHIRYGFDQLDRGLPAQLTDGPVRLFIFDNGPNVRPASAAQSKRVGRMYQIRGYGFRIIIDNDCFITPDRANPDAMYGTVVKFNSLTDADRSRALNQDLLRLLRMASFFRSKVE